MDEYYLVLSGAYNNAGDFLIVHRAIKLLERYRPDRTIKVLSRREILEGKQLELANKAEAILITGGPALQKGLWPEIVRLNSDLSKITSPILLFGVGWKGKSNSWNDIENYTLSDSTIELLKKINSTGIKSSLRDSASLSICRKLGLENFQVTGCPALFNEQVLPTEIKNQKGKPTIVVSMGVTYLKEREEVNKNLTMVKLLKQKLPNGKLLITFHHSLNKETLEKEYGTNSLHYKNFQRTEDLVKVFKDMNIPVLDISGGLDKFRSLYDKADAHIGYRVHGHVYMISCGKPSVLLSEDNRAMSFKDIIGGCIFDATNKQVESISVRTKIRNKLTGRTNTARKQNDCTVQKNAVLFLQEELEKTSAFTLSSLNAIKAWEGQMIQFLKQLP